MDLNKLSKTLKEKRENANWSSSSAAEKLGVTSTYYSRLENGKERPSKQLLRRIAEAYGLPAEDLRLMEELAGYTTGSTSKSKNTIIDQGAANTPTVKLDAQKDRVLFSDSMFISINDNGVVFDFAQKVGPTNEQQIVSRVGVSYGHARKIHSVLGEQLAKAKKMGVED